jgi:hypothetical protein
MEKVKQCYPVGDKRAVASVGSWLLAPGSSERQHGVGHYSRRSGELSQTAGERRLGERSCSVPERVRPVAPNPLQGQLL